MNGQLNIMELLSDESVVNYLEKYLAISNDPDQKAILTSCCLRQAGHKGQNEEEEEEDCKKGKQQLAFSFTIIRDNYDRPYAVIGNFIPQYVY